MRKPTLIFQSIILILLVLASCERQRTLSPYKWPALGGEFDSLVVKLEWQFNDFASFDSIEQSISLLDSLAGAVSGDDVRVRKSRALYWKARYLSRIQMHDSALNTIRRALELNDSSKYYYDMLRIKTLLYIEDDSVNGSKQYRHFDEAMSFAHELGDIAYEAHNAINMGNLLSDIGEYEKGLYYLRLADSLYEASGYHKIPVKNKINEARILNEMGDKDRCDSILKGLLQNPIMKGDTFSLNVVSRNLYVSTGEKSYLLQAYREIKDIDHYRYLRGLYEGLLVDNYYREEKYDSVIHYALLAMDDLPYVKNYGHKASIWFNVGLGWAVIGNSDSALMCRIRYENYLDSSVNMRRTSEVLRLSALHELGIKEAEYEADIWRRNMVMAVVIVALAGAGAVTALLLNRRHIRQRMAAMEKELELEKAKRKIAATALTIEEKDKVLGTLRAELSEMREEGDIKDINARRLESTIKSHLLRHDSDETFREMFDVVNPGFTDRLRQRCPDLADSYVRLACYMLMELDSKRIAGLMMIKPESLRQARWRLRRMLQIPEGESLESFLRHLNKPD